MTGIVNEVSDAVVGLVPIVLVGGTPEVTEAFLTCGSVGGSCLSLCGFSLPTRHAPGLLDPPLHLRSFRFLQGRQIDVATPIRCSKRRRRATQWLKPRSEPRWTHSRRAEH